MNVGTSPDEKFVTIGAVNDYNCDQEEVLDYSSLPKAECSTQLEKKAADKEPEAEEDKTKEIVTEREEDTPKNINCIDVIDKEELLWGIGGSNCCKSQWNLVDRMSNVGDGELSNLALIKFKTIELADKPMHVDLNLVWDYFKAWRLEEWVSTFLWKSVFPKIKMVWYGKPRVTFNSVLKILFWEFYAKLQNGVDTLKD